MSSKSVAPIAQPRSLREAIAASGLTTNQIIAKVQCSRKSLSNWRVGKRPSDYSIGRLSDVLDIDLWPLYREKERVITPLLAAPPWESNTIRQIPSRIGKQGNIDDAIQHFLTRQLQQLWDNFHFAEETASIATIQLAVSSHIQVIEALAKLQLNSSELNWIRRSLCEAYILTGRIARDQMDYVGALKNHKAALDIAHESTSQDHIAAATMRLAETLQAASLIFEALAYCNAAVEQTRQANPRVRGELLGLAALISSRAGDSSNTQRMLDEAATLAVGAASLPTTGGINFSETAAASYLSAEALEQGDTNSALLHIERARKLLTVEFPMGHNVRWEAHLWINQAKVHSEANEIEAASADLRKAAMLAQSISSQMAYKKVQDTVLELTRRHRQPVAALRNLREELMQIAIIR